MSSLFPMGKWRLVGTIAILSFGFTSLAAILGGGTLVPALFVFGVFILMPLVALLGSDLPLVAAKESDDDPETVDGDPVELLRERYARGDLSKEEFEARLDRLLETEDLSAAESTGPERELLLDEE
jgi:uncharacterized membrane protein